MNLTRYLPFVACVVLFALGVYALQGQLATTQPSPPGPVNSSTDAALQQQVVEAFNKQDFAALEKLATGLRNGFPRLPDGMPRLGEFYYALDSLSHGSQGLTEADFAALEKKADAWMTAYPRSSAALITRARLDLNHAWYYRGRGYANTVSADAWKIFGLYLLRAQERLVKGAEIGQQDPFWFTSLIRIAGASGHDVPAVAHEAAKHFPDFDILYTSAVSYLLPKWGGDYKTVEEFAGFAATQSAATLGETVYTRLYLAVAEGQTGNSLFTESNVSWPRMRQGFEDWLKRYPHEEGQNLFVKYACLAGDRPTAARLISAFKGEPREDVWHRPLMIYYLCRQWAVDPQAPLPDWPLPPPDSGTSDQQWDNTRQLVGRHFLHEDFDSLEQLYKAYFDPSVRINGDIQRLHAFYSGLEGAIYGNYFAGDQYWEFMDSKVRRWLAAKPDSHAARLVQALLPQMQVERTLFGQDDETVTTLPEFRAEQARKLLEEADGRLGSIRDELADDPQWYAARIQIAHQNAAPASAIMGRVAEALNRVPAWDYLNNYMQEALTTVWGDDMAGGLEQFARSQYEQDKEGRGPAAYARIYLYFGTRLGANLFTVAHPDWTLMKRGLDMLVGEAGQDRDHMVNVYAAMACLAGDKATTHALFEKEGARLQASSSGWPQPSLFTRCQHWQESP